MDNLEIQLKPSDVSDLHSDDADKQMSAIEACRKFSIDESNIKRILRMNLLPRIVELLRISDVPKVQMEAARYITSLAAENDGCCKTITEHQGLDALIAIVKTSVDVELKVQCIWALSNIIGDRIYYFHHIISLEFFSHVLKFSIELEQATLCTDLLQNAQKIIIWTFTNLISPPFASMMKRQDIDSIFENFVKFLSSPFEAIRKECIAGLEVILESKLCAEAIFKSEVVTQIPRLIESYIAEEKSLLILLKITGNLAMFADKNIRKMVELGFVEALILVLDTHTNDSIVSKALWTLSNIADCSSATLQLLFDVGVYQRLLAFLQHGSFKIQRDAVLVTAITLRNGNLKQVKLLVASDILRIFTKFLDFEDDIPLLRVLFRSLYSMLCMGELLREDVNLFAILFDKYGTLKKIEALQFHQDVKIQDFSIKILKNFFYITRHS